MLSSPTRGAALGYLSRRRRIVLPLIPGFRRTVYHHIRQLPSFRPVRIRRYLLCSVVDGQMSIYYRKYTAVGMV
jgi:hypothetical protein